MNQLIVYFFNDHRGSYSEVYDWRLSVISKNWIFSLDHLVYRKLQDSFSALHGCVRRLILKAFNWVEEGWSFTAQRLLSPIIGKFAHLHAKQNTFRCEAILVLSWVIQWAGKGQWLDYWLDRGETTYIDFFEHRKIPFPQRFNAGDVICDYLIEPGTQDKIF